MTFRDAATCAFILGLTAMATAICLNLVAFLQRTISLPPGLAVSHGSGALCGVRPGQTGTRSSESLGPRPTSGTCRSPHEPKVPLTERYLTATPPVGQDLTKWALIMTWVARLAQIFV